MKAKKPIETLIFAVREQKVILDADLAEIYGVETRVLNQAVKRNAERFPDDFLFELTREEILRISQTVTSLANLKFSKQMQAFTEHGALMAASVLNSPEAVEMSVFVIRAFLRAREQLTANAASSNGWRRLTRRCWPTTRPCGTSIANCCHCCNRRLRHLKRAGSALPRRMSHDCAETLSTVGGTGRFQLQVQTV